MGNELKGNTQLRVLPFLNATAAVRDWFLCEPSLSRAAELGCSIRPNDREDELSAAEWADMIGHSEAVLTTWGSPRLTEDILCRTPDLKVVAHVGGSVSAIVSDELFWRGIKVSTANPIMARSVAEAGIMLMLMGLRQVHRNTQLGSRCQPMDWMNPKAGVRVPESATIGIWGFGEISQWVVRLLQPFAPREILVCSNHLLDDAARQQGLSKASFDEIFNRSDVIFVLAGMTQVNRHRVGPEQLQSIRDNAVLINLGRAPLIQRDALIEELRRDRFTGAFDVFHTEPLPEDDPLTSLPNVILTPHNAGTGRDGLYLGAMVEEIDRCLCGEPLRYEISSHRAGAMTDPALAKQG